MSVAERPAVPAVAEVVFRVAGLPAPKGSRTTGRRRDGSVYSRPASGGEKPWTDAVALVARAHRPGGATLPPPYAVSLAFAMPRPGRAVHPYPTRSDLDKLIRGVLDGLVRGDLIADDRHVTHLIAMKRWAERRGAEGVTVIVQPVTDDEEGQEGQRAIRGPSV